MRPDSARAADLGVTSAAIADTLRIATAGDFDQGLAKLNLAQRQIPIVVRLPEAARAGLGADSSASPCRARSGHVMLGNVATIDARQRARRRSTATTAVATSTSRSS